jgi:type II secretory pathway pseudopilin PulG
MSRRPMHRNGFTIIELVIILMLVCIVAVVIAPKMLSVSNTSAGAFADKLRADTRYAQTLAMTRNQRYRVYVNTAPAPAPNGYAVVYDTSIAKNWSSFGYVQDPVNGGNLSVTLGSGQYTGITITSPAAGYVEFNSFGTPAVGGGFSFVGGIGTITINASAAATVTVADQTGAVN